MEGYHVMLPPYLLPVRVMRHSRRRDAHGIIQTLEALLNVTTT